MRIGRELAEESLFGQFGRFVFDNYAFEPNYQDIIMKMDKIELWMDQPYRIERVAEWSFGIPEGMVENGTIENLMFFFHRSLHLSVLRRRYKASKDGCNRGHGR